MFVPPWMLSFNPAGESRDFDDPLE